MDKIVSKNILHQFMITNKIFGNYRYIGEGSNGFVYHINDQVIKITEDNSEIETAEYFYNHPHINIVEYYMVDIIDNIGIINMEYVTPLDSIKDKKLINKWHDLINPNSLTIFSPKLEEYRMDILDLRSSYNFDVRELHWRNCGFNIDGKIKFFDMRLIDK